MLKQVSQSFTDRDAATSHTNLENTRFNSSQITLLDETIHVHACYYIVHCTVHTCLYILHTMYKVHSTVLYTDNKL